MLAIFVISMALIVIDQIVKAWVIGQFAVGSGAPLVPGLVSWLYVRNEGAAWGVFSGQQWLFFLTTCITLSALLYWLWRNPKLPKVGKLAGAFILAGGVGNFIDRLRFGYVVDMFHLSFIEFPVFNVADICLTIGVLLMMGYLWRYDKK